MALRISSELSECQTCQETFGVIYATVHSIIMKVVGHTLVAIYVAGGYKTIVRVIDESGTTQLVTFDNNVHKMSRVIAWEIMEKEGINPELYFPDELNLTIGKNSTTLATNMEQSIHGQSRDLVDQAYIKFVSTLL
ncbi:hypothetical protein Tco_0512403 [Tanacetum coccineum]